MRRMHRASYDGTVVFHIRASYSSAVADTRSKSLQPEIDIYFSCWWIAVGGCWCRNILRFEVIWHSVKEPYHVNSWQFKARLDYCHTFGVPLPEV